MNQEAKMFHDPMTDAQRKEATDHFVGDLVGALLAMPHVGRVSQESDVERNDNLIVTRITVCSRLSDYVFTMDVS